MTQNWEAIERVRLAIDPLVSMLGQGHDVDDTSSWQGDVLTAAMNVKRGVTCGKTAVSLCATCVINDVPGGVCGWMAQNAADLVPEPRVRSGMGLGIVDL